MDDDDLVVRELTHEEAKWKGIHNIEVVGDRNNGPWIRDQFWDNIVKAFEEMGEDQDEL